LYNPIVGIYELKKIFGLRDLPNSDHRTARILRYFRNDKEEQYVNVDEHPIKFWENFWCSYTDCVFVDLNTHQHDQVVLIDCSSLNKKAVKSMEINISFDLKVVNPVVVVKEQITDTSQFMRTILLDIIKESVECGSSIDELHIKSKIDRAIYASDRISHMFNLDNLNSRIVVKSGESSNQSNIGVHNSDIKTLLEIAKNSNLEDHEEADLKRLIFDGPD